VSAVRVRLSPTSWPNLAWLRAFLVAGSSSCWISCTTRTNRGRFSSSRDAANPLSNHTTEIVVSPGSGPVSPMQRGRRSPQPRAAYCFRLRLSHKSPVESGVSNCDGMTHVQSGHTSQVDGTRPPPAAQIAIRLPPLTFLSFSDPFTRQPRLKETAQRLSHLHRKGREGEAPDLR
jgi:hypothetical protein